MKFRPNYIAPIILISTYILFSKVDSFSYKNILLQSPQSLTNKEIENLEQENLKNGWGASFNGEQKAITFYYHDDIVDLDFEFYENIPAYIDEQIKTKLVKTKRLINEKIVTTYILHLGASTPSQSNSSNESYCVNQPRNFKNTPQANNPQNITLEQLADLIKTKNVIFYTGAGISAHAGIWTMESLEDALEINFNCEFDQCMQNIIINLEKIKTNFREFCRAAFKTQATPAHYALKSIALLKQSQILTENFDLLHEHAGIKPLHISGPWLKNNVDPNELKKINLVLCIGLSHDDRGFLGWYKTNNPNGIIIAIDLNKPSYLGNEDFLIQEDCQEVLPKLAKKISQ